jgi:hypothetical protein
MNMKLTLAIAAALLTACGPIPYDDKSVTPERFAELTRKCEPHGGLDNGAVRHWTKEGDSAYTRTEYAARCRDNVRIEWWTKHEHDYRLAADLAWRGQYWLARGVDLRCVQHSCEVRDSRRVHARAQSAL